MHRNPTLTVIPSDFYELYSPHYCELRLYLSHKGVQPSEPGAFEQVLFRLGESVFGRIKSVPNPQ